MWGFRKGIKETSVWSQRFFNRFQLVKNTVQCSQVPSENTTIGKGNQACVFHMCLHTHQKQETKIL